jgi:hypothetical protein
MGKRRMIKRRAGKYGVPALCAEYGVYNKYAGLIASPWREDGGRLFSSWRENVAQGLKRWVLVPR